jgi:hypothetical protein
VSGDIRLVRALVACYPPQWRRRYGDEYAQLLCDMRVHRRPALIADSLIGAARAYGGVLMSGDSPMTLAVWGAGLFTVAGIGFGKLAEDFTGATGPYVLLVVAAAVALLALAVGAVVWYGVLRLALALSDGHGVHSAPNVAGFVLIAVIGVAVVAATAWAAATVLRRVPAVLPPRLRPAAVMTVATGMAVATVAALIWGLRVHAAQPAVFRGDYGLLATPFVPSWLAVVLALAAATVLAGLSARRHLTVAG